VLHAPDERIVVLDPGDPRTPAVLAERERLGLDRFDEVWKGVPHLVPPPSSEHGRIEAELLVALHPPMRAAGLRIQSCTGVFDPTVAGYVDYCVPDLVAADPEVISSRGIEGRASLVVEVRSPGDDSFAKLPFYGRVGVAEVVIVDRDTKAVRRWLGDGDHLVESIPGPDGSHLLACVPVKLSSGGDRLVVVSGATTTTI
jgi:Uma2 family endonuclease